MKLSEMVESIAIILGRQHIPQIRTALIVTDIPTDSMLGKTNQTAGRDWEEELKRAGSLEKCWEIYRECNPEDEVLKQKSLIKMEGIGGRNLNDANTFQDCWNVFVNIVRTSPLRQRALNKALELTEKVEECLRISENSVTGSPLGCKALDKAYGISMGYSDEEKYFSLRQIIHFIPIDNPLRQKVLQSLLVIIERKLLETGVNMEEISEIHKHSPPELQRFVVDFAIIRAKSLVDFTTCFNMTQPDSIESYLCILKIHLLLEKEQSPLR